MQEDVMLMAPHTNESCLAYNVAAQYKIGENRVEGKTQEFFCRKAMYAALAPTLKQYICFSVGAVPKVESVFALREGRLWYVNTVVPDFDPALDQTIYEKEANIIDEFAMFNFDFNIISREGHDVSECVTDPPFERIFQRD